MTKSTIVVRSTLLFAMIVLAHVIASGQHVIRGNVVDEGYNGIVNVPVRVETAGGDFLNSKKTGAQGYYEVPFTTRGTIKVTYGNLTYTLTTVENLSGRTDHNLTKVLLRKRKPGPAHVPDQGYESQGSLEFLRSNPKNIDRSFLALNSGSGAATFPTIFDHRQVPKARLLRPRLTRKALSSQPNRSDNKLGNASVAYYADRVWVDSQSQASQ